MVHALVLQRRIGDLEVVLARGRTELTPLIAVISVTKRVGTRSCLPATNRWTTMSGAS